MICIIRIKGEIGLNRDVVETLSRLRIRKKYSCVVIKPDAEKLGMIKRVKDAHMVLTMDRKIKDALKNTKSINLAGKTILTLNEFVFNRLLGGHLDDDELDIKDGPTDGNAKWKQDVSKCFDALGDNVGAFRSIISNELAIIKKL